MLHKTQSETPSSQRRERESLWRPNQSQVHSLMLLGFDEFPTQQANSKLNGRSNDPGLQQTVNCLLLLPPPKMLDSWHSQEGETDHNHSLQIFYLCPGERANGKAKPTCLSCAHRCPSFSSLPHHYFFSFCYKGDPPRFSLFYWSNTILYATSYGSHNPHFDMRAVEFTDYDKVK